MFLTGLLSSIGSGIISGIIASVLLNKYYWNQAPNLIISDKIAVNKDNEYHIKIVNKSRFYITNIYIQVQLITVSIGNGGSISNIYDLKFPSNKLPIINPYNEKDKDATYAVRLGISKNLEDEWIEDDHTYLKIIIYCSNERNNSSKLFEKIFYKKSLCIKYGNFKYGTSCEIE